MMNIEIVKMEEEHLSALSLIEKECFSTPWSENALREELSNQYARFFVAICDNKVCGYIGSHNIIDEVYITNVAVSKAYRKQGIGESIVRFLVNESKKEGADFITLEVRKSNLPAISLYEKCGFYSVGERKCFYENPKEDAILMTEYFNIKD